MSNLFGFDWDEIPVVVAGFDAVIEYKHQNIGTVLFSTNALHFVWDEKNNYKAISVIHEKTIFQKPCFITLEAEKKRQIDWNNRNYTVFTIEEMINDFPANIIELQERVLMLIHEKYPKYGQQIREISEYDFFSEDQSELEFIVETMMKNGLVNIKMTKTLGGIIFTGGNIEEKGWLEVEKNLNRQYLNQVFIAMWFDTSMEPAYKAIERAITEIGMNKMRIDRKQHNNEISGEILFEIKKSKVIIADVTGQRNGVYFEAGYAMGQKKPVIWCCKEDDLINIHFDTRQYNHVIWKDESDLYIKIKDRLLATILNIA